MTPLNNKIENWDFGFTTGIKNQLIMLMKFCYVLLVHIFTGILSASRKPMVAFSSSELIFSTLSSGPASLDLDSIPIPRTMILRKKNILFVKFRGQL